MPIVAGRLFLGDRRVENKSGAERALGAARASRIHSGHVRAAHHAPIHSVQWGGITKAAVSPQAGIVNRRQLA